MNEKWAELWDRIIAIWKDPVWSTVIAAGILGLIALLGRIFRGQISKGWHAIFKKRSHNSIAARYGDDPAFIELFVKNIPPALVHELHAHEPEYVHTIQDLVEDGLVRLDGDGIPTITARGKRWIDRKKKAYPNICFKSASFPTTYSRIKQQWGARFR